MSSPAVANQGGGSPVPSVPVPSASASAGRPSSAQRGPNSARRARSGSNGRAPSATTAVAVAITNANAQVQQNGGGNGNGNNAASPNANGNNGGAAANGGNGNANGNAEGRASPEGRRGRAGSDANAAQSRLERQQARAARHRERENAFVRPEPQVLTETPPLLAAVLLSERWAYPFWSAESCALDQLFCARCHQWQQANVIRSSSLPVCLLPMICFLDLLTLGNPCGVFYPGLGSAMFGCYTRVQIRIKYRIQNTGLADLGQSFCCAHLATTQQFRELEKEGVEYAVPLQHLLVRDRMH